jgi:hypothetical protein
VVTGGNGNGGNGGNTYRRAMTSLNLANNDIGRLMPPEDWTIDYEQGCFRHADGRTSQEMPEGSKPFGLIAVTNAIKDMRALTKLDLSFNGLGPEGGKALAVGLKGNRVITELNIAINYLGYDVSTGESDTSGAVAIAATIRDMKAILQFTFSGDSDDSKPVTMETSMVEANFGMKALGVTGAIMVGAFLPKCT